MRGETRVAPSPCKSIQRQCRQPRSPAQASTAKQVEIPPRTSPSNSNTTTRPADIATARRSHRRWLLDVFQSTKVELRTRHRGSESSLSGRDPRQKHRSSSLQESE